MLPEVAPHRIPTTSRTARSTPDRTTEINRKAGQSTVALVSQSDCQLAAAPVVLSQSVFGHRSFATSGTDVPAWDRAPDAHRRAVHAVGTPADRPAPSCSEVG